MEPHLRLHPGQKTLTPAQEAEARRFAQERIAAQLSTELVDEPETEQLVRHAYVVAGFPPPQHIQWVDGPHQLIAALVRHPVEASVLNTVLNRAGDRVLKSVPKDLRDNVWDSVWSRVRASVMVSVGNRVGNSVGDCVWDGVWDSVLSSLAACVHAYMSAPELACFHFLDRYLVPNALHALAHLNERVSGYWLGQEEAILLRRPKVLSLDAHGRLHSATGKCVKYRDGWGFYAWHGVRVPEQVILAPERLAREDFLNERNMEVRQVIQERMGERFMLELGGRLIDEGPRGRLYEVLLPHNPEQVARYVQVKDASTERQYFVRVPPTIQTSAEAVAWSFTLSVEAYDPAHET